MNRKMAISESASRTKKLRDNPLRSVVSTERMEYNWPHDPIATDTNLAEIDFEDFRNEDLVYAFSCGEEESGDGGSSTDMSICKSEVLFSSMRESGSGQPQSSVNNPRMKISATHDSMIEGAELDFSEQVKVNKNHYTLTYSRNAEVAQEQRKLEEAGNARIEPSDSGGRMTTWGNLGKRTKINDDEENINNNNNQQVKDAPLVSTFMKKRDQEADQDAIPMMRSKDTVNQYLKSTSARLTSIEEQSNELGAAAAVVRSGEDSSSCSSASNRQQYNKSTSDTLCSTTEGSCCEKGDTPKENDKLTDLNFLQDDVGLWDAFFLHARNANKFQSVLNSDDQQQQRLPMEAYLSRQQQRSGRHTLIRDMDSLRLLLPQDQKHLLPPPPVQDTPDEEDRNPLAQVCKSLSQLNTKSLAEEEPQKVKVKEAWAEEKEQAEVVVRRKKSSERLLDEKRRRSYHNPDHFMQVYQERHHRARKRPDAFPKSGSQNDLCDVWTPEELKDGGGALDLNGSSKQVASAEYPFQQTCMPTLRAVNFDLTQKRGLFMALYSAVERMLSAYQEGSFDVVSRFILFHELCPALYAILADGLKPDVLTSFGRMPSSVWRMVEAVTRTGPTAVSDLVMMLNARFSCTGDLEGEEKKFAGFVAGLLNMSELHIWFSRLKWSMDVLLRFYERHAFVCALHKETRMLFDELIFCLQRLYTIPFKTDLPFSPELLDSLPVATDSRVSPGVTSTASSNTTFTSTSSGGRRSRIPRPISLPKRIEAKLGQTSLSPVRGSARLTAPSPTSKPSSRKSRVRDTIRLFDSKNHHRPPPATRALTGATPRRPPSGVRRGKSAPRTGGGEAMGENT